MQLASRVGLEYKGQAPTVLTGATLIERLQSRKAAGVTALFPLVVAQAQGQHKEALLRALRRVHLDTTAQRRVVVSTAVSAAQDSNMTRHADCVVCLGDSQDEELQSSAHALLLDNNAASLLKGMEECAKLRRRKQLS